jgi:expansin (peptidoglycan-binding protein)
MVIPMVLVAGLTACIVPGKTYTGEGTWYDGTGEGNCMFDGTGPLFAAINHVDYQGSSTCGAYVRATGPDGTVTVQIVDQCPECPAGDLDFSPQAFDMIADLPDGRVPISWEVVSGGAIGNVQYRVKEGSSQWWLAIQARHIRNMVTKLEVQSGGTWVVLKRESYNYFVAPSGMGVGPFTIRLTDIWGEQLVHSGVTLSPGVVQTTASQFATH